MKLFIGLFFISLSLTSKSQVKYACPFTNGFIKDSIWSKITFGDGAVSIFGKGEDVLSVSDGFVNKVDYSNELKYVVIISSENGYKFLYAELSSSDVKQGDKIKQGAVIGKAVLRAIDFLIYKDFKPVEESGKYLDCGQQ